jgi:hypothetical protein
MSRRTTRRPGRRPTNEHPSIWFFVALGVGLIFIIWMYAHVATNPVPAPAKPATATQPKR